MDWDDAARGMMREGHDILRGWFRRVGLATIAALLIGLAILTAPPAFAAGNACEAAVNERLARMKVDPGDVRSTSIAARIGNRRGGSVSGYDAWVALESCRGSIVLRLDRRCRVKEVYSRGACRFPDLPHH